MCSGYRARAFFSRYSTLAYQAPPASVSKMPDAFIADIDKSKITTARMMDRTCFTFAVRNVSMISPNLFSRRHFQPNQGFEKLGERENVPATVMLSGPAFLFAVKLTILRPNAITPLKPNATAIQGVNSWALQCRT